MITQKTPPKRIFWIALVVFFLLTGGQISASSAGVIPGDLIITEFVAANGTGLIDEDGDYPDWIEIYNRSNAAVNLAGWALTNDPNQPQQWTFPDMTLDRHKYLVVFASGKNRKTVGPGAALHTNFKLSKKGDFLALYHILENRLMDAVSPQFPEQFRDVSYGRYGDDLTFRYLSKPTPGHPNDETLFWAGAVAPVEFSKKRGFYEAPFTVELTTATPGATIRYTVDGSGPTESQGTIYTKPITVQGTTLLRATAFEPGFRPSEVRTQTYIFLDDVVTWLEPPARLPASAPAQLFDFQPGLKVPPAAAGHETDLDAGDELKASLKSIPTMSLVTAGQNLADLHARPLERGKDSERPVSVELIYPDGNRPGFQINAGLRLQGAWGSSESTSKQSFRLFFRGKYGATRLEYPLFPDSAVETFDTLVLQAGSVAGQDQANYTRNEWLRASQLAISGLGAHGIFVHLYLNGAYWGLYNVAERPDEDFISSYLGGEQEDWFIANQDGPLTDDLGPQADKLNDLFTALPLFSRLGLDNTKSTQSENRESIYSAVASYLDSTQFIDFTILNRYTGWPMNNWHVAIRLPDQVGRGKILVTDEQETVISNAEHTQPNIVKSLLNASMPNPDFRMLFADRLYKHLFNNGALTDANAQERWIRLNNAIEPALIAELAHRESLNNTSPVPNNLLEVRNDDVLVQLDGRADKLIMMMREAGYYPNIDPPVFGQEGGLVESGFTLTMSLASPGCSNCTIYYTTDGSDPRMPVTGAVFPTAKTYSAPLVLTATTHLKARVWDGSSSTDSGQVWSALHEATFSVVEQDDKLRLTEIMYNPLDGDDYEFIELQNMGNSTLNLANFSIDDGIRFTFPPNFPPLAPGEFSVLVSNPIIFAERYPDVAISGTYDGHLSNKGEKIILKDAAGQVVIEVEYNDEYGWPVSADGRGDSLTLINEAGNPDDPKSWRASANLNGSPGTDN